jgi:hypothetical protein
MVMEGIAADRRGGEDGHLVIGGFHNIDLDRPYAGNGNDDNIFKLEPLGFLTIDENRSQE